MINKKTITSHLAIITSLILLSSVLFGNNVSFGDTAQETTKAQITKQQAQLKAESEFSNSVAVAKSQYVDAKIAAKDNPEKLRQAKISYNKAIQIAKEILYQKLTLANEQYKQSITKNSPVKSTPTSPETKSGTSQAKLAYAKTIKDAKNSLDKNLTAIKSNYKKALDSAKNEFDENKAENNYKLATKKAMDEYNMAISKAKIALDKSTK
ncbi:hypothetical protein NZNM25_05000 [Nitrosopumilus zosterae]|uniref:Uncharacterized protein n=1 Tax=Nitrosopumilus zosterae TaxID=718286 RepID=A0A2S2KPY6_9ARCH|nr:hypothetical protein [Nitrosopumilus zosterae]BDQ31504.1 hypothetical protein NZOSNM25_001624 [Nitrosopumilus zosterae]GBH33709.1 hypothetical protein NZNM25_05000 [Nitrosopumilus zosterae]